MSTSSTRPPAQYRLGPMISRASVHWAFSDRAACQDPEYIKAVIRSYIDVKRARGRGAAEIAQKVAIIQDEYPMYRNEFEQVKSEQTIWFGRRNQPSGGLGFGRPSISTTSPIQRAPSNTASIRSARTPRTSTSAAPPQRLAPLPQEEGDPPPPPYSSNDPEPQSTRLLNERLAAEAEAASRIPREPSPAPEPTDPEVARIYEESQFEEAKRMSLAAEREERELEEAMRLSLAESSRMAEARGGNGGPSGSTSLPRMDEIPVFDDSEPSSRRASSYAPQSLAPPMGTSQHHRGASETHHNRPTTPSGPMSAEDLDLLTDQMQNLDVPSLQPQKAILQSNNPFLSPSERGETHRTPSSSSLRDTPGSSRTSYKPLPTPPSPKYAPPPGPPPNMMPNGYSPTPRGKIEYNTVILVDDGEVMTPQWDAAKRTLLNTAKGNTVEVYFVNSKRSGRELAEEADLDDLLAGLMPRGTASLSGKIESILREHIIRLEQASIASPMLNGEREVIKALKLVVIVDLGIMAERETTHEMEEVLGNAAERIERSGLDTQIRIKFMPIGNAPEAREVFEHWRNGVEDKHSCFIIS